MLRLPALAAFLALAACGGGDPEARPAATTPAGVIFSDAALAFPEKYEPPQSTKPCRPPDPVPKRGVDLVLFYSLKVTPLQKAAVEQKIRDSTLVSRAYRETQELALRAFERLFVCSPDLSTNISADALPAGLLLDLHDEAASGAAEELRIALEEQPGVDEVQEQRKLLQRQAERQQR